MRGQGCSFTEVYLTEGHPAVFKEALIKFVAEDICRYTGLSANMANVLVHDRTHCSTAAGGQDRNRGGKGINSGR